MELSKEQLLSSAKHLRELAETAHPLEGREYLAKAELAESLADQYPSKPVPVLNDVELECQGWTCKRDWEAYPPTLKEVLEWRQSMRRRAEQRRSISLTGAGVNRMRRMAEAEKCYNEIGLLLKIAPPSRLHEIPNKQFDRKFVDCWVAAGQHLQRQVQGKLSWLRAELHAPSLEHLSFRLGNQLFFIRLIAEELNEIPGTLDGLFTIAKACCGHACLMPMQKSGGSWEPGASGWGLIDANNQRPIDPILLVSDERIEMTDWELHDFAVQIVRQDLRQKHELMSWQSNPQVTPTIWFVENGKPAWVLVKAVRYPETEASFPENWEQIAKSCENLSQHGYFASVAVASPPEEKLCRGFPLVARYQGLRKIDRQSTPLHFAADEAMARECK